MDNSVTEQQQQEQLVQIVEQIREDILSGLFKAGEKLTVATLKKRYGTGHSPIREALSRIQPEGLISKENQRGYRVRAIDPDDLAEITKMKCWLEDIAIRESIRLGGTDWEDSVVAALHRLNRTPDVTDSGSFQDEVFERHAEFHKALFSACNSKWLLNYIENLQRLTERYRRSSLNIDYSKYEPKEEHAVIANAAIAHDADRASKLLMAHNHATHNMIAPLQKLRAARS